MLAVRIEEDNPGDFSILSALRSIGCAEPMRQSCLECFALTAVFVVNNNFRAGFARALCGVIRRAVINNENVIEPFACSPRDVADVFFVLIRWNNRSGLGTNVFRHVERSRDIPLRNLKVLPRGCSTSLRFARNDNDCKLDAVACAVLSAELSYSEQGIR